jgi:hypothetical protein
MHGREVRFPPGAIIEGPTATILMVAATRQDVGGRWVSGGGARLPPVSPESDARAGRGKMVTVYPPFYFLDFCAFYIFCLAILISIDHYQYQ